MKGATVYAPHWALNGWVGSSGPVGHSDLWKEILELIILHEDTLSFQWVPSHLDIMVTRKRMP